MKGISIKVKLIAIVIFTVLTVSIIEAIESIRSIQNLSKANIEEFKKDAYAQVEEELKNYTSIAIESVDSFYQRTSKEKIKAEVSSKLEEQTNLLFSIVQAQYEKYNGKIPVSQLKNRIKEVISSTRYGKNGYFWINDLDAVIVDHPIKPSLNGKDLSNFADKNGKRIFSEFASEAKRKGEGFVDYAWAKPGFDAPQEKISYVKLFKPFNWVIGTGTYIDDVTSQMQKEALKTVVQMRYSNNGYFWINDKKPVMISHPMKPSLNGSDLSGVKDSNGVYLFKEMVKAVEQKGEGVVRYFWHKNDKEGVQPKVSYVKEFKPWGWIIGTGVYIDEIEKDIANMKEKADDQIGTVIFEVIAVALIICVIITLIISFTANKLIIKPINDLNEGILNLIANNSSKSMKIEKNRDDELGNVVDSFNKYLTKIEKGINEDNILINEAKEVMDEVKHGWYSRLIEGHTSNRSLEEFKDAVNNMIKATKEHFTNMNIVLEEYAKYDYRKSVELEGIAKGGVFELLISDINKLKDAITKMLMENKQIGMNLSSSSGSLLNNVDILNQNSNDAAARLEETAAAIEQITGNIRSTTENIVKMAGFASEVTASSQKGEKLAKQTTVAMDEINSEVTSINEAITIIDQIAFQTNILSLNAAVEAATAGEAGKGFAVVAQEVRNLASRSAEAAREIKNLVENATNKANHGKRIADEMISGYMGLNENITKTIELISDIETSSKEQQHGIEQINDAIGSLDDQTQKNAVIAAQTKEIAADTNNIANDVIENVNSKEFTGKDKIS